MLLLPVSENLLWSRKGSNLYTITSIIVTPPRCSNSPFLGEGPLFSYNQNIIYASFGTCTICHILCAMYCVPRSVVSVLSAMHCRPCTVCQVLSIFTFCRILCAVYYVPFHISTDVFHALCSLHASPHFYGFLGFLLKKAMCHEEFSHLQNYKFSPQIRFFMIMLSPYSLFIFIAQV